MSEVLSQPRSWQRGVLVAKEQEALLPRPGARVALVGCGTSLYVAEAVAAYREARGLGETDAFPASETPLRRHYDLLVAITRSGTTSEVLDVLRATQGTTPQLVITALEGGPVGELTKDRIVISWADERSIVQTRFATTVLAILLAHCGWDVEASAERAEQALGGSLPDHLDEVSQIVFLGRGAAVGMAREAALKLRETVGAWTEAYPTREFRHGPISAVGPHTIVWLLDDEDPEIDAEIAATGAHVVRGSGDPLAELVRVHRAVGWIAERRGINPDAPRFLIRSVILR